MNDFIEQAAKWLSEDDTAYADMADARRAAKAMLGPALTEIKRLEDRWRVYHHDLNHEVPTWLYDAHKSGAATFHSDNEIYVQHSGQYAKVGSWLYLDDAGHIRISDSKPFI